MNRLPTLLLSFLLLLLPNACSGGATDYSGAFAGDGLELELHAAGKRYTGTISLKGRRYEAEALPQDGGLVGEFRSEGKSYPFRVARDGKELVLESGGAKYRLRGQQSDNPLAAGGAEAPDDNPLATGGERVDAEVARAKQQQQSQAAAELQAAATFTRSFKHPSGLYFMYPDGWSVKDTGDGGVAIVPPDAATIDGQQAEVMALAGEESEVERVDHPELKAFARQFVAGSLPYLQATGDGEVKTIGQHQVLHMNWRGDYQGHKMAACFQILLLNGYAIGAFTFAPQERFAQRLQTMSEVVRTLTYERPEADPRLVGSWRYEKTYISGTFSSITVRNLVLRADGTCYEGGRMMAGMEHQDSGGNYTGSTHGDAANAEYQGRWHTEGSDLVMEWSNAGTERWGFYIEGSSMLWKSGGEKKLWKRVQ
ncbi:MAG TPA: hypothetical protein ENI87_05835 [bacterium]|nr:hypothetical protein [bacterium]